MKSVVKEGPPKGAHARSHCPIFVVGYMHSGTTLLLNILSQHSSVFRSGGETKFFQFMPMIRRAYPSLEDNESLRAFTFFTLRCITRSFKHAQRKEGTLEELGVSRAFFDRLFEDVKAQRDYGAVFRITFDHLIRKEGKLRWLEKTPTHVFHIDEIVKSVPNGLFVEIVRDLRDVLASKKTRRATVWESDRYTLEQRPAKHLEKAYNPVWDTLSWKSAIRAGLAAKRTYEDRVFSVRYQDLVRAPEARVREICAFLGLEFEPVMLEITSRNPAEVSKTKEVGIRADSVERWRHVLSPGEVATCQWLAKKEMEASQYVPASVVLPDRTKIPFFLAQSAFEFGVRLFRRWKMGGYPFLANVLSGYWTRFRKLTHR